MTKAKAIAVDHPGTFIAEELAAREWAQADLAYILGMNKTELNKLINGGINITPDKANALGAAFDMPPEFFLNLQNAYNLSIAKEADPGVEKRAKLLSKFPIRAMVERGWIEDAEADLLDIQMMRFFSKDRIEDIPFINDVPIMPCAAKKSDYNNITPLQYIWLHRVRKIAEAMDCPSYSKDDLLKKLATIRTHMLDADDLVHIPKILFDCGVRLVLVEAFPGSKIDGVCLWLNDQPVIGMSMRYDRFDNFCFVLRHEIEHVLQEDGKDGAFSFSPVDENISPSVANSDLPDYEQHANTQAAEFCVPSKTMDSFLKRKGEFISERDVLNFALSIEINPAVVIGQIQHRLKKFGWLRKYMIGVRESLSEWKFMDGWGKAYPITL